MKVLPVILTIAMVTAAIQAQDAPVSQNEADIALKKTYAHLKQVLDLPPSKFVVSTQKSPLTREQYVGRLYAMYEYIKPKIQPRVKPLAIETKRMMPGLTPERLTQLKAMVSLGLLQNDCLLVTGPRVKYTPKEFGKLLGYFLTRILDITMPLDPKYSPELMPNNFES